MTSERNSYQRRQIRARLLAQLRDGDPCPRCGYPMWRALARHLDVGHVVDRAAGGTFADGARLEHRACNRAAGQARTTAILKARGWAPSRRSQQQAIAAKQWARAARRW